MTFTLTGTVTTPAGTAHTGFAKVTPVSPIRDTAGNVLMVGSETDTLTAGAFSFTLPDDTLADGYVLEVVPAVATVPTTRFAPGAAGTTLDLVDIVNTDIVVSVPDTKTAATTEELAAEVATLEAADTAETNARTAADAAHVAAADPHAGYLLESAAPALITSTVKYYSGTGSPEGVVTAAVGSRYIDTAATTGAIEWIKASGTGSTGWKVAYGDTGWRNVASGLLNGWTNSLNLRRVGATVLLSGSLTPPGGIAAGGASQFYTLPTGFRTTEQQDLYTLFRWSGSWQSDHLHLSTGGVVRMSLAGSTQTVPAGGGNFNIATRFLTADAWPSTLPGS